MAFSRDHSKFQQIAEGLSAEIADGKLRPGERIQSARQLAERFHTSLSAVTGAFALLEKRGLLVRKPRSGVFVATPPPPLTGLENKILLCMPSQGHFFHDLFMVLFERLTQNGIVPLLIDSTQVLIDDPRPEVMAQVHEILRGHPAAAVVFGCRYWQNPILTAYPELKKIFLLELDAADIADGDNAVLLDFRETNRQMVRHLQQQGCRRIAYAYGPVPRHPSVALARTLQHYDELFTGYEEALDGAPLYLAIADEAIDAAYLKALLARPDAPDAIVCQLDHTAHRFAEAAGMLGIRIPEELKLTGFFNTPWSRPPSLPLTTAAFDMEQLAAQIIAILKATTAEPVRFLAPPELIVRHSTGIATAVKSIPQP